MVREADVTGGKHMLSRRSFLLASAQAPLCGAALAVAAPFEGLGRIAASRGLLFGSMVRGSWLAKDRGYADMVARECGVFVSRAVHWSYVERRRWVDDFAQPDADLAWAEAHGMQFRGHALLWHREIPPWFAQVETRDEAIRAMTRHIERVCRHFAGKMHSWDVVNEAIKVGDGNPDGLRRTAFLDLVGPEFLDLAFHGARQTDPKARLVYNEYDLELDIPAQRDKRRALLRLLDNLKKRGTPIDAVGVQAHLSTVEAPLFNEKVFADFLTEIADRGFEIMLTELDVVDRSAPSDIAKRDAEVAASYRRFLDVALANRAVKVVVTWGLTDRDSWISLADEAYTRRADGLKPRPLPFDVDYLPKPAYWVIAEALKGAPRR